MTNKYNIRKKNSVYLIAYYVYIILFSFKFEVSKGQEHESYVSMELTSKVSIFTETFLCLLSVEQALSLTIVFCRIW